MNMFVLVRAVVYAALFIGFVLVYLPGRFLSWSGIAEPATTGAPQIAGMIIVAIGTAIALWCVFTFVFIGKGTPAALDPPKTRDPCWIVPKGARARLLHEDSYLCLAAFSGMGFGRV